MFDNVHGEGQLFCGMRFHFVCSLITESTNQVKNRLLAGVQNSNLCQLVDFLLQIRTLNILFFANAFYKGPQPDTCQYGGYV